MGSAKRQLNILVADDNPLVATTLCDVLTALGHVPLAVEDGQAAVDQAIGGRFDVLLMDVEMPRKDGITACLEILTSQPQSVIILITGSDDAFEHARMAGVKAVLHKPVSTQTLRNTIDLSMGVHATGRSASENASNAP